jgi:glycyl-tRNA synthetase alpha chain
MLFETFDMYEKEGFKMIEHNLPFPAYDYALKCSHIFNLLDARGALSVNERARFIGRVRNLARECAKEFVKHREEAGFPLIKKKELGV